MYRDIDDFFRSAEDWLRRFDARLAATGSWVADDLESEEWSCSRFVDTDAYDAEYIFDLYSRGVSPEDAADEWEERAADYYGRSVRFCSDGMVELPRRADFSEGGFGHGEDARSVADKWRAKREEERDILLPRWLSEVHSLLEAESPRMADTFRIFRCGDADAALDWLADEFPKLYLDIADEWDAGALPDEAAETVFRFCRLSGIG